MDAGGLVPDDLIIALVSKVIAKDGAWMPAAFQLAVSGSLFLCCAVVKMSRRKAGYLMASRAPRHKRMLSTNRVTSR